MPLLEPRHLKFNLAHCQKQRFPPGTKKPEDSPRSAVPAIGIDTKSRRGIVFGTGSGNCCAKNTVLDTGRTTGYPRPRDIRIPAGTLAAIMKHIHAPTPVHAILGRQRRAR